MRRTLTVGLALTGGLLLAAAARAALDDHGDRQRDYPRQLSDRSAAARTEAARSYPKQGMERSIEMSTRYLTNMLVAIAAGFVIVASFAFAPGTLNWLAFAITGIGVLALTAGSVLIPRRGIVQRSLDGAIAVLAIWTIVESRVFTDSAMMWITFGTACGILALAVIGLTIHELRTERVVHTFEDSHRLEHVA